MSTSKIVTEEFVIKTMDNLRDEINERFESVDKKLSKLDIILEQLDSIAGDFKKFDEEQTTLSYRQSIHSDKIEKLEVAVFGVSSS